MEQFEIRPIVPLHIGNLDISFTNASLSATWSAFTKVSITGFGVALGA